MKWVSNKTFPYPVLSPESNPADRDYVKCEFQACTQLDICDGMPTQLNITCQLSEKSLIALIKKNKAKYAIEVHCRKTHLRRLFQSTIPAFNEKFARGELHERVEISAYIVCTDKVKKHKSDAMHPEFNGRAFDFHPGDVLAMAYPDVYWVEPKNEQSIGSIFELNPLENQGVDFSVNWDNPKIQIIMNPKNADQFHIWQNNSNMWASLLSSVYLSALIETLRIMQDSEDDYSDKKWFGVISQRLSDKNIVLSDKTNFLETAQILLDNPVNVLLAKGEE